MASRSFRASRRQGNKKLGNVEITCESKVILVSLYYNQQGLFLNITHGEESRGRFSPRVILDEENFDTFQGIVQSYVEDQGQSLDDQSAASSSNRQSSSHVLKTQSFRKGFRRYYVDVCQNEKGRFARITMLSRGTRQFISFPFSDLQTFHDKIESLLDKHTTSSPPRSRSRSPAASSTASGRIDENRDQVDRKPDNPLQPKPHQQKQRNFKNRRQRFWRSNKSDFPPQNDTVEWNVYCVDMDKIYSRYSLVFEYVDSGKCLLVDLRKVFRGEQDHATLNMGCFYTNDKTKEQLRECLLGTVKEKGNDVLQKAFDVSTNMGDKNGVEFVRLLAEDLGLNVSDEVLKKPNDIVFCFVFN